MKPPTNSRRSSIAGAAIALLMVITAACGADDSDQTGDGAGTVTVTDATGVEQAVTVTDTGVYALDEWTAVSLLALGVTPMTVETFGMDTTVAEVLEYDQVPMTGSGSIEAIAAADPELIIGVGYPMLTELADQHREIAPSIYTANTASWNEQIALIAQVTGRTERAGAVSQAIQNRTNELATALADAGHDGATFSVLQNFGGTYYTYGPLTLVGTLIDQVGFTRSDLQGGENTEYGYFEVSEELLAAESDADIIVSLTGESGGFVSAFDSPLVRPRADALTADVGDAWPANHPLAAWIILHDIEAIVLGDGAAATVADTVELWNELEAAVDAVD